MPQVSRKEEPKSNEALAKALESEGRRVRRLGKPFMEVSI